MTPITPKTKREITNRALSVARQKVKEGIKAKGGKVSQVYAKDITKAAKELLPSITIGDLGIKG